MESSLLFHHPCNIFISGPSGSGKTQFVKQLIEYKSDVFQCVPQKIVWCYKEWQTVYAQLQESQGSLISFVHGIPEDEDELVSQVDIPHLLIFDDMLGEKDEEEIKLWFTRKGHHRNASVVYITQNLFQQSKSSRTLSLNAHYMIVFQNSRDKGQIKVLSQQVQLPHLIAAYQDATAIPHGYLVIDFHPRTPDAYRLRTDIFHHWVTGDDRGPTVYTNSSFKTPTL
jgi:energy-coupling factor transporter ATP-binding protein EcfA2